MNRLLVVTTIPITLRAFLLPFADHFRAKGWQVDAMAQGVSTSAECLARFDRVWDVEWSRRPQDLRNLLLAPPRIRAVVEHEAYDIVHVHTPVAAFVTRYALRSLRKQTRLKVIYTAHGFHFYQGRQPLENAIFLALEKLAGRWTDYLTVINREDEETAKCHILPSERVRYMPGIGVDLNHYSPAAVSDAEVEHLRRELGITGANPLLVCLAEFTTRKRPQDVLQAFARLARPDVHLALAGQGPLMADMRELANRLRIQEQVHFLGLRQNVPTLLKAAVATLLVSEREGLPRSVMESLCLETPVIGTQIRGTQDLLEDDCGLLVKVGDVEELAGAIAWILDHPQESQIMGKRGRERMASYDLQRVLTLHETLYTEAIAEHPARSKQRLLQNS